MKTQLILILFTVLLVSNIAGAHEQKAPSSGVQEQEAPNAGMTGEDMMGPMGHMGQCRPGMMRPGMKHQDMHMRVMMILMDTDGDGALSLEEVQAAHAKIFKAIDATGTER
jgi:hypothetical protein